LTMILVSLFFNHIKPPLISFFQFLATPSTFFFFLALAPSSKREPVFLLIYGSFN
jgi:hypothetical protein